MNGGGSRNYGTSSYAYDVTRSLETTRKRDDEAELARVFADTLNDINQFDSDAAQQHRDTVCDALGTEFDVYDVHGGGSRTRHTYVDGLSDIDFLLDLGTYSASTLPNKDDPAAVLSAMEARLKQRLPGTEVVAGRMAVTVRFSDGHELQVLPAFQYHSGYRVPDPQGGGWTVTRPRRFAELLSARNGEVGGKLLRTIKLGKLICGKAEVEIKSYHLENIALQAFEHYTGPRTDQAMLGHLFNFAKSQVMRPMPDVTGQETHVDRYLADTGARSALARRLAAIERQIATAGDQAEPWRAILRGDA